MLSKIYSKKCRSYTQKKLSERLANVTLFVCIKKEYLICKFFNQKIILITYELLIF